MEQVLAPLAEKLQENEAENDRTSDEEEKMNGITNLTSIQKKILR